MKKGYLTVSPVSEEAELCAGSACEPLFIANGRCVNPDPNARSRWYALYTNSRHEKKVAELLHYRQFSCFLPLYRSVRRWKDRRKEVDLPLFPGYVFVRIPICSRPQVLTVPGVVQIVSFNGKPAAIADSEIDALRRGLSRSTAIKPHPYLKIGKRVRVRGGPFAGMRGILIRRKHTYRVVLSIDLIMRSLSVEIDESEIEVES